MVYFKVKRKPVSQVYNDGVIQFSEKKQLKDKYGTPLNKYEELLIYEDWFRKLGVTAQDIFYANADDKKLTRKVAIKQHVDIDVKWAVTINKTKYEVYRVYYSYQNNETEVSLVEV